MKKIFFTIIAILIVVIIVIALQISNNNIKNAEVLKFNKEFEIYKDKKIYGADVTSLINKAIDNNETNGIEKDEDGNYIEDDNLSLKIDIILLSTDKEGNINELKYPMERLQKRGLDDFIASFSITDFSLENIEYNSKRQSFKNFT